ncbi:MAG: hypothetical protein ACYSUV_21380 [Planctomycetota bacterium]|jgi:hypothetical protein
MSHHITENHRVMRYPDNNRDWIAVMLELDRYIANTVTAYAGGAGAIPVTHDIVEITTTGADALTLADGQEGQELILTMVADGGVGTVTPANPVGYTNIAFDAVGETATLLFTNAAWVIKGIYGATPAP